MELSDIRSLIPFYVANTLDDNEKAIVENALKEVPELLEEVEFWSSARIATQVVENVAAQNHLSSELIVDYADGTLKGGDRLPAERHLQMCDQCREDYDIIKETLPKEPERDPIQPTLWEKTLDFVRSLKPVYLVPIAAMLVTVVFMLPQFFFKNSTDATDVHYVLEFQMQVRGQNVNELPEVALTNASKKLHLTLCLIPDTLTTTRYNVSLMSPQGTVTLPGSFSKVRGAAGQPDSVKLSIDLEAVQLSLGNYTLYVTEDASSLPSGHEPLQLEPYKFTVARK